MSAARRRAAEEADRARDAAMRAGRLIREGDDEAAFAAITDVVTATERATDALESETADG